VLTTDFITPVVDDARTWGRIAAVNAAGDVYAMGGRPLLGLNLVAWNMEELGEDLLVAVLEGAAEAGAEGGWVTVGGHTVDDPEPKFGLAVVGEVHPDRVLTNRGLRPGDALVLTKPLGTGIVATAVKRGAASATAARAAVESMLRLNAAAAEAAAGGGASAATDVTGFGLLGHLRKMLEASGCRAEVDIKAVPVLDGARELALDGHIPGGTRKNLEWVADRVDATGADPVTVTLLADAQTAGGLLFGADSVAAEAAVEQLQASGHRAAVIGRALPPAAGTALISLAGASA
jgi:selenide, water dikinase